MNWLTKKGFYACFPLLSNLVPPHHFYPELMKEASRSFCEFSPVEEWKRRLPNIWSWLEARAAKTVYWKERFTAVNPSEKVTVAFKACWLQSLKCKVTAFFHFRWTILHTRGLFPTISTKFSPEIVQRKCRHDKLSYMGIFEIVNVLDL
jgi:hypothetical protein